MTKQILRAQIRAAKRQHSPTQLAAFSKNLCNKILNMPIYQSAHTLLLYSPLTDEADVSPIINDAYENDKTVLLPKVVGDVTIRWIGKQHNYDFHGIFLHSLKIRPKWRSRKSPR